MKKEYKQPIAAARKLRLHHLLCASPESYKFNGIYEDENSGENGIDVD